MTLPIESVLSEIFDCLQHHPKMILQAPPGAGKSTFLPLQLLKQPFLSGKIIMLEPRRLAARNIANYLASQLGEPVGQTVGFRIRQETKVSQATRLEIVTEGILTRMIQTDPELSGIKLIIFDEFHERSIHADLALALTLEVQSALRDDLKLLIMSATLDSQYLAAKLDAPTVTSEGRSYPVEIRHQPCKLEQIVSQTGQLVLQMLQQESGSLLVFLPGAAEINKVRDFLAAQQLASTVEIHTLYGDLDKQLQQQAIAPCVGNQRKVVLATNIAETSLTIDGIRIVIDSGLKRQASFNPKNGVTRLKTVNIAKSSAVQRAGRAGRLMAGICYRLDSAEQFERRMDFDQPEILNSDLMSVVMEVANWGSEIEALQWVDQPPNHLVAQARTLMQQLEVLDSKGKLTALGQQIATMGSHPRIAHMLIKAKQLAQDLGEPLLSLACYLAAVIEEADPLPKAMRREHSNVESRVRWLQANKNPQQLQQVKHWAKRLGIGLTANLPLEYCGLLLALAFPDRIAKSRGQGFQLSNGFGVVMSSDDPLSHEPMLVVADIIELDNRTLVGLAASISEQLLTEYLPHLIQSEDFVGWDNKGEKLIAETQQKLGKLVLSSKPKKGAISNEQRAAAFIQLLRNKGLKLLSWEPSVEQLRLRLLTAHRINPALWPDCSQQALLTDLEQWLAPYLNSVNSVAALQGINLRQPLLSRLDWQAQQQLDSQFPERLTVPTGNQHAIEYREDQPPKLSVRIQEMFGLLQTPTLANGQLAVVVELLSPARRPLQLTQDLAGFWQGSYQQVKKEMKGRYPKHYWPDDPAMAMPTSRLKKHMGKRD